MSTKEQLIHEFYPSQILCDVGLCKLGQGGFGCVLLGFHRRNQYVAIKCFKVMGGEREKLLIEKKIKHEYNMLLQSRHDNIATVFGYTKWPGSMGIVMQYYEGGNLCTLLLDEFVDLGVALRLRINSEIASGVSFIHNCSLKKRMIHGDLKPENILLTCDLHCKIADFGSARTASYTGSTTIQLPRNRERPALTWIYAAPEKLLHDARPKKEQDTYSCGLIYCMTLTREIPFPSVQDYQDFRHMLEQGVRPNCEAIQELMCSESDRAIVEVMEVMMTRCWDQDPTNRPDMLEVRDEFQQHLAKQDPAVISQQVTDAVKEMEIKHPAAEHKPTVPLHTFSSETGMFYTTGSEILPRFEAEREENPQQAAQNQNIEPPLLYQREEVDTIGGNSTESQSTKSYRKRLLDVNVKSSDDSSPSSQPSIAPNASPGPTFDSSDETHPKLPAETQHHAMVETSEDETIPKQQPSGESKSSAEITFQSAEIAHLVTKHYLKIDDEIVYSSDETNPKLLFSEENQHRAKNSEDETIPKAQPSGKSKSNREISAEIANSNRPVFVGNSEDETHPKLPGRSSAAAATIGFTQRNKLNSNQVPIAAIHGHSDDNTPPKLQQGKSKSYSEICAEIANSGRQPFFANSSDETNPKLLFGEGMSTSRRVGISNDETSSQILLDPTNAFLVVGGDGAETDCVKFDINTKQHHNLPSLNVGRCETTAVKVGTKIFVFGGAEDACGNNSHRSCETLDMNDPTEWSILPDLLEPRDSLASAVLGESIYVAGGRLNDEPLFSFDEFDIGSIQWIKHSNMLHTRSGFRMIAHQNTLYCIGGSSQQNHACEFYDFRIGQWQNMTRLKKGRWGLASVLYDGKIYSIGGWNGQHPMSSVEYYDLTANKWAYAGSLNVGRAFHGACVVGGKIYAIGGQNSSGQTGSVEVFDPVSDSWSLFMDLDEPRYEGAVVAV